MVENVAVVTGANRGIGYGIVKGLCTKFDGTVYLTARKIDCGISATVKMQTEVDNMRCGALRFHQLDITDRKSICRLKQHLLLEHGGLDILINNAGVHIKADDRRSKDKRFEYEFSRQYNWHLRSKASADYEANYCLTIRNGCAYYNELDTSVHLNRCASNKQNNNLLNFRVMVSFRQPNDQEIAAKEARMRVLQLLSDEKIKLEQEEDRRNAEENRLVEESKATYVLENYDVGYEDKLQKNDEKIEPTDGVSDGHSRNEQEDCPKPSCSWE